MAGAGRCRRGRAAEHASYTRGPWALAFGIPTAVSEHLRDNPEAGSTSYINKMGRTMASLAGFIADQTPLDCLQTLAEVATGRDDMSAGKALGFMAGQFVPASGLVRWVNNIIDPTFRKANTFGEVMKRDYKFWDRSLEPHTDPDGKVSVRNWTDLYAPFGIGKRNERFEKLFQDKRATLRGKSNRDSP